MNLQLKKLMVAKPFTTKQQDKYFASHVTKNMKLIRGELL
ncbi:hypothetical protein B4088_2693 [Bacillus cereus]|uniref:Uncharacterized protein n=1 Tax=Bacillus cereus TaxID=1396 RepID=A0A161T5A4_BACCE|nr:hypothetical protein B4088_2693 [Bacillus cereus]